MYLKQASFEGKYRVVRVKKGKKCNTANISWVQRKNFRNVLYMSKFKGVIV